MRVYSTTLANPMAGTKNGMVISSNIAREFFAAGIVLTSLVPEVSRWFIFGPISFFWLWFAFVYNPKAFHKAFIVPDIKSYSVYLWLLIYVGYQFTGPERGIDFSVLANQVRLGFSILMFNYYLTANNIRAIKQITTFGLFTIIAVCITTLSGLAMDPMASRLLATGREEEMRHLEGMFIGSFGFIYGLVFVTIALLGVLQIGRTSKLQKVVFIVVVFLAIYTIFAAAFMMALLLTLTGFILFMFRIRSTKHLMIISLPLIVLLYTLSPSIYPLFQYIGDRVAHVALSERFHELAHAMQFGTFEGTINAVGRWEYLTLSVQTFWENPVFGVGDYRGWETDVHGIGGHSAFFDQLARFGIFGSVFLFIALFVNARFVYRSCTETHQKVVYYCSIFPLFLLGFINTMLFVPIIVMAYFIVPGIIWSFSGYRPAVKSLNPHEHSLVR